MEDKIRQNFPTQAILHLRPRINPKLPAEFHKNEKRNFEVKSLLDPACFGISQIYISLFQALNSYR